MPKLSFISRPLVICCVLLASMSGHLSAQAPAPAEDIRGPKALVEIPVPEKPPYALWAGIGGGVLLLTLAAILLKNRKRKQRLKSPPEVALSSLAELEASREAMAAEAFANRAAQTVRQYIADRFGLAAPRRTTEEFLHDLAKNEATPLIAESDHLRAFLKSCDLAKFAGSNLDASQRGELINAARGFIHSTSKAVTP
ncbi:MAG: hypothetical protein V4584_05550 [Verrucomicrobiota bacterium]